MGCGSSHLDEEEHHYNPEQATLPPDFVQLPKSVLQAEQQLLNAWGGAWTTTGYTDGHHCIKSDDTSKAEQAGASLLYGEVLPAGLCLPISQQTAFHLATPLQGWRSCLTEIIWMFNMQHLLLI